MSAAAPTSTTELPDEQAVDRENTLMALTAVKLRELALKHGIVVGASFTKKDLVVTLARSEAVAAELAPAPTASTGDVDANGDIIGAAPPAPPFDRDAVTVNIDNMGFPLDGDDVAKLTTEHLEYLRWSLIHEDAAPDPGELDAQQLVAWITRTGYQVPGQTTIDDAAEPGDDVPHIPTASPAPRTEKVCTTCSGTGGWQTDTEWESCGECCSEPDGQLTLVPGGDAPAKSILNVAALRYDLSRLEFKDGDTVSVSFDVTIDKIAFIPEKSGKATKRRVRTHAGAIDPESVVVTLAS